MKLLFFSKIKHFLKKVQDIMITNFYYVIPALIKWFYHRKIRKDIFLFDLKNRYRRKVYLFQHGECESDKRNNPVTLILHGLYSHPFVMQHLAEVAQNANIGHTFSLYMPYDETNHEDNRTLIKHAIDRIEKILLDNGYSFNGIVLVGHSMGAIEAAYTAFVDKDRRILSVISIAGRLKVVESLHSPCSETLKGTINKISNEIHSNPNLVLYQIVAGKDWNAPLEATIIRKSPGTYHIVEDAMHFNILFHDDIFIKLQEYLQKSFK